MAKLKNPEINSILFDKEEEERLKAEQEWDEYWESQREYEDELKRQKDEEYKRKEAAKEEKNQLLLSLDSEYNKELEGNRRSVFYDEHYDFPKDSYYVNVYEERPKNAYTGRLTETVYQDGSSYTDWGCWTSIPEHWSNEQAENYMEMRANGYKISEILFDKYIKSPSKNFDAFLNIEKLRHRINKNIKRAEKSPVPTNSIASIATIKKAKNQNQG